MAQWRKQKAGATMRSDIARRKLAMLIPRLASDQPGEVIATVAQIGKILKADGNDFHDMAKAISEPQAVITKIVYRDNPQQRNDGEWMAKAVYCAARPLALNQKEMDFVIDMTVKLKYGDPTEKQAAWLDSIWHRLVRKEQSA